jgi:hypothetical protein
MTLNEQIAAFFEGRPAALRFFEVVRAAVEMRGPVEVRVSRSQIAFARRRAFAWVWTPDRWLRGKTAPLVLSVALSRKDDSVSWKQVVEPRPGRWMHHLEVCSATDVDEEVRARLQEAAEEASRSQAG